MANKTVDTIAKVLAGVGALNWGLVSLMNLDLVSFIPATVGKIAYIAIGAAGAYVLYLIYAKRI